MQKITLVLLVVLVVIGCGEKEKESQDLAKDEVIFDIQEIIWERDISKMVLIPAGSFEMGDLQNEPEVWMKRSRPVHTVKINAFYMDNFNLCCRN